ncbi:MAG: hypothetical protein JW997_02075 [Actinobacteria bacterium]|nr:hypothetical protein [Actinomycetota bacterium]
MYKCMDCGNEEKFIGFAEEKGNACIYQEKNFSSSGFTYSWIFNISDKSWSSSFKVIRCSKCNSLKVKKL